MTMTMAMAMAMDMDGHFRQMRAFTRRLSFRTGPCCLPSIDIFFSLALATAKAFLVRLRGGGGGGGQAAVSNTLPAIEAPLGAPPGAFGSVTRSLGHAARGTHRGGEGSRGASVQSPSCLRCCWWSYRLPDQWKEDCLCERKL